MQIKLSDHFNYPRLLRFVLPSVAMMIFTSIYGVVDGFFVSNFVGKTAFAAVNLILPLPMGLAAIGFMIGTGGSALVSKTLGEGKKETANEYFSMLIYFTVITGIIFSIIAIIFLPAIARAMGADEQMLEDCVLYGRILLVSDTLFMLQNAFQSFFVAAEKPRIGLVVTLITGFTNMVLDALFIAVFRWGVAGAALATATSQLTGGTIPIIYFARKNKSLLRLIKTPFRLRPILRACANGCSELMTNLSLSIVNIAYNFQLMKLIGENGVAAYGTILYVNLIFIGVFLGYSIGVAPIVGYHDGMKNYDELKSLFRKSLLIIGILGVILTGAAEASAGLLAKIFVGYDPVLYDMTKHGFRLYSFAFLIIGFNIFGSAFFTALNDGAVSATISFLRTLVFQLATVFTLPLLLKLDGVWLSIVVAESLSLLVTATFFITKRKKYHYY